MPDNEALIDGFILLVTVAKYFMSLTNRERVRTRKGRLTEAR